MRIRVRENLMGQAQCHR